MLTVALAAIGIALTGSLPANAEGQSMVGQWQLNEEATKAAQPKAKRRNRAAGGRSTFVVQGMPVPLPSGSSVGRPTLLKTPVVVGCSQVSIEDRANEVLLNCGQQGWQKFYKESKHGRRVKWNESSLTESYSSTSRRVKQEFTIDDDGRLHVKVTLMPKRGAKVHYIRIYDRVTASEQNSESVR